jgi:hypothetical protein
MDPYLEGHLWPDVHQSLASQFKRQLSPLLRPRYVVRLAVYFVRDRVPTHELDVAYPDVEVVRPKSQLSEPGVDYALLSPSARGITPPSLVVPTSVTLETRLTSVQVRDSERNELVTSIEIVSPANKREPGLSIYRRKRSRLIRSAVHLLEIDLIRRGERPWQPDAMADPPPPYLALLTRTTQAATEVWPIQLTDMLPVLPVPLRAPDADVPLDLQAALASIYDESDYGLTIDYAASPPPSLLSETDRASVAGQLAAAGLAA